MQRRINLRQVYVFADEDGQAVVLLVFERREVKRGRDRLVGVGLQQRVDDRRVVKDAVQVSTPATRTSVVAAGRATGQGSHEPREALGHGAAHVDFVTLAVGRAIIQKREPALLGGFFAFYHVAHGQQTQASGGSHAAFHTGGVLHRATQHLVAA